MTDNVNPYESPAAETSAALPDPLPLFVIGAILGSVAFIVAMTLIPGEASSPSAQDLLLANYLGFMFPMVVGSWSGWMRHSCRWAAGGMAIGFAIGGLLLYALRRTNSLAVMVACPCLLGGAACMAFGSGERLLARWNHCSLRQGHGRRTRVRSRLHGCAERAGDKLVPLVHLHGHTEPLDDVAGRAGRNGPASGSYLVLFLWASVLNALSPQP